MAKKRSKPPYSVIIQWSDEDDCYVVSLPEWGPYAKTHGETIEEAAKNAREVLELLMEGETSLPEPKVFHYPGADLVNLSSESVGVGRSSGHPRARRKSA